MNRTSRDAILLGVREAARAHDTLNLLDRTASDGGGIDVFAAISQLDIPLIFRPLGQLLGVSVSEPARGVKGIMVTTARSRHIQRFTAAHELGHILLGHKGSLDRQIDQRGRYSYGDRSPQETAADAFAAEFLLPRWLYVSHAKQQGWTRERLTNPSLVYQLSLRVEASYEATCWGLLSNKVLPRGSVLPLLETDPKTCKHELLGTHVLENPWADVWEISDKDTSRKLRIGPEDVLVLRLTDHAASGYTWDLSTLTSICDVLSDEVASIPSQRLGGPRERRVILRPRRSGTQYFRVEERRPWEHAQAVLASRELHLEVETRVQPGLAPQQRQALLQASSCG